MSFNRKVPVHAVYFDCKSAFDLIDVGIVSRKLTGLGVNSFTVGWIVDFLTDRSFFVRVGSADSATVRLTRGTPQGAHISSLIFSIMIYDLSEYLPKGLRYAVFADDIKIFSEIAGVDCSHRLQLGIDGVVS